MNGILRIFWGNMAGTFGFKKVNIILIIIQIACVVTIQPMLLYNRWAYAGVLVMSIMTEGAIFAIFPLVVFQKFGNQRGQTVYSIAMSSLGFSAVLGSIIV